ncbi:MAG: hypothetical protein R3D33_15050 [Hyphomicrobiaceae bacterium]
MLSEADARRVDQAIKEAERRTSGEIVAVVASESDGYLWAPLLWAAVIALLVPWPLIFFTWIPVQMIYMAQLVAFLMVAVIGFVRPLRFLLVPRSVKRKAAHRRAVEQFVAQNLHTTKGRTGVLIYVSRAEQYAEIIADQEISAAVAEARWTEIVALLTDEIRAGRPVEGFLKAIAAAGDLLAAHFPPGSADDNELPDHLIVLN